MSKKPSKTTLSDPTWPRSASKWLRAWWAHYENCKSCKEFAYKNLGVTVDIYKAWRKPRCLVGRKLWMATWENYKRK